MDYSEDISMVKTHTMEKNTENKKNARFDVVSDNDSINENPMPMKKSDVLRQYNIGKRTNSLWYRCPDKWTEDMILFYTKIQKSKRNYDYTEELRKTKEKYGSSDMDWVLHPFDFCKPRPNAPWEKCNVCRQYGHTEYYCKDKFKCIVCIMCGMEGHNFHSCDKKRCLSCGILQNHFSDICQNCVSNSAAVCDICNTIGHSSKYCTESWRRFHNTISTEKGFEPSEFASSTPRKDIEERKNPAERGPEADEFTPSTFKQYFEARKSPIEQGPESAEFVQPMSIQDIQETEMNPTRKRKFMAAMSTFYIQGWKRSKFIVGDINNLKGHTSYK